MPSALFFSILRAAIWTDPDGQPTAERLQAVIDLIHKSSITNHQSSFWSPLLRAYEEHAMLGVVAHTLCSLPAEIGLSAEQQDHIQAYMASLVRQRYAMQQAIATVFRTLETAGIRAILLKGEGLAMLYPRTCLRAVGDIDLIVPHTQYEQAVHTLQTLTGDRGHEDYLERHYQLSYQGITIEVHHHPGWCANGAYEHSFQQLSDECLTSEHCDEITIAGMKILIPGAQYNALYVFNHLLHHMHDGGVGLRQFLDWSLVLYHQSLIDSSLNRLIAQSLNRCGLLRPWQILGGILVLQLGLSQTAFPLYDDRLARKSQGKILRRLIEGGNFGHQLRTPRDAGMSAPARIWHNLIGTLRQTAFLWTLFPSGALAFARDTFRTTFLNHTGHLHDRQL